MSVNSMSLDSGGLQLPVTAADVGTTLTPLDPGRAVLAGLFKAAINDELGEVWAKLTTGLPHGHQFYGSSPVEDVLELEPSPVAMQERKAAWPLLCVHRSGSSTCEQHTLEIDRITQPWEVHYILGPLAIGDLRRFGDVCVAVIKIVQAVIRRRGHKSYQNGALQFFPGTGHFAAIWFKGHEGPGQAAFAGDERRTPYYAVTMRLETMETSLDNKYEFGDLDAIDYDVSVGTQAEVVPSMIQATTETQ